MTLLIIMGILALGGAFFSGSEAALFTLRASDRRQMADGSRGERLAVKLLEDPDRILSTILFCNLVLNFSYFAVSSMSAIDMQDDSESGEIWSVIFAMISLVTIIFVGEMLPKSLGVICNRIFAKWVSYPLYVATKLVEPIMPVLQSIRVLTTRFIWPNFRPESYMEVRDLEKAISLTSSDAQFVAQEQAILRNLVSLSEIRVDEWMNPRTQFEAFRAPVSLHDLRQRQFVSDYLLIKDAKTEEVISAVYLPGIRNMPSARLELFAHPVIYVPWCATVADALESMKKHQREVVAVVNEHGETIGILTFEDILDTLFTYSPSRSKRLFDQNPIHIISPGKWLVAGMTSLRRLERNLEINLPPTRSVTIGGVIQESLQRLAKAGDETDWGPFHLRVLEIPFRGHMLVELKLRSEEEQSG